MNKNIALGVLGLLALVFGGLFFTKSGEAPVSYGGMPFVERQDFQQGLTSGTRSQFTVNNAGRMSVLTTGTTTTIFKSSSATQGYCVEFNATSSNTVLNRTYAASSTPSTAGIISVVRYGACN